MLNSQNMMKSTSTLNFETPLQLNFDSQSNIFFVTRCTTIFGKAPNAQYCSSKINTVRAKTRSGRFKSPKGSYRIKIQFRQCIPIFVMSLILK